MSLKSILMDIFPFLFKAAERFYEDLPQPAKDALLQSGKFAQILKLVYTQGYDAFVAKVSEEMGMSKDAIDQLLLALAKKMSIDIETPNQFFDKLQTAIDKGLEDSAWDNLWHSFASQLAIILSGGRFNWSALAMGVIEFVYKKFIQKG